ncbi:hypothetical protein PR048_028677 [Dryococelus australis]|uniref:Uncharacterized protein n=1 Tax=Dryococelus australis TaxID=614101 RepID=A0ABQ9GEZ7_9NEOP|nr:hypothetical protein PR048_028677 [Dryococelus australis]
MQQWGKRNIPEKTSGIVRHDSHMRKSGGRPRRKSNQVPLVPEQRINATDSEERENSEETNRNYRQVSHTRESELDSAGSRHRSYVVLLASDQDEPDSILYGSLPDYACRNRAGRCRWLTGFSQGSPVSHALPFWRYSTLTSLHLHRSAGIQREGKMGDPRENTPASDIVRHRSDPFSNRTRFALLEGDQSSRCTTATPCLISIAPSISRIELAARLLNTRLHYCSLLITGSRLNGACLKNWRPITTVGEKNKCLESTSPPNEFAKYSWLYSLVNAEGCKQSYTVVSGPPSWFDTCRHSDIQGVKSAWVQFACYTGTISICGNPGVTRPGNEPGVVSWRGVSCNMQTNAGMAFYSNMIQPAGHTLRECLHLIDRLMPESHIPDKHDMALQTKQPMEYKIDPTLNFTALSLVQTASFLHWLLPGCEATRFLTEQHLTGTHGCEVFIHWCRVTQGRTGFNPRLVYSGWFSQVGMVLDDVAGRRVLSGISRYLPPFHYFTAPSSPHFTLIGSRDFDVSSRPNLFTHSLSLFILVETCKLRVII